MAARLRGIHVAVTGDDSNALAQLTSSLRDDGALVTIHDSARTLARLIPLLVVNVLVVDLVTLTGDAIAMVHDVRALTPEEGSRLPIIALYNGSEADQQRLIAARVDCVLRKPVDTGDLARTISAFASPTR
jgi:DNA-binding response OmpR family regulator